MNATKDQLQRVVDYLVESDLPFSQIDSEEAEVDLVQWEQENGEKMTLDTFVERFKIRRSKLMKN